jgi:hypothetical protein
MECAKTQVEKRRSGLHFATTPSVELYCCLGTQNPSKGDNGVWNGDAANIAAVDQSGYYVIGKLVGVRAEDLRHGTKLKADQLVLDDGMTLGFSRRIMNGDRQITIEASQVPALVSEMPDPAGDPNAAAQANAARN